MEVSVLIVKISNKSKDLLRNSTFSTLLQLPQMTDAEYDEIKYIVEFMGGHWREKYKGFIFDAPPEEVRKSLDVILSIKQFRLSDDKVFKIKNQFYPTPDWLAYKMVITAGIKKTDAVLEPSAGRGAILKYIAKQTKHYYSVEYNKENAQYLRNCGYRVNLTSFEEYAAKCLSNGKQFDKIVMNPPFSREMDIRHIILAYRILKSGGRLVALMAENSIYYDRPITHQFNQFLEETHAQVTEVPHGSFKESGTNVDVIMIVIDKT